MGDVELKGGVDVAPNPGAGGGGGGGVIVPADGDNGIELPGNGGRPPPFEGGGGDIGAIAGTDGKPTGDEGGGGGETGAVSGAETGSGVPVPGRGGTPDEGGGGVTEVGGGGLTGGGGLIGGMLLPGAPGRGGIPEDAGAGGGMVGDAIGGMLGVDGGGISDLVFSPGNGGRPPLFPPRSGIGGIGGTGGIELGSVTGAVLFSSAVVSLISFPGTGTRSMLAGVTTGTIPCVLVFSFGSSEAIAVSDALSPGFTDGSMYFLMITAESNPTKDAVTTNPALVSRFIEPAPYKLGGQCRQNLPCPLIMSDKFNRCVHGAVLKIGTFHTLNP